MATKANPADQIIPAGRFTNNFNQVFSAIEAKKYRKSIQEANLILEKFPTNGEVTCAKGMCMAATAQRNDIAAKEAGIKLMKQGLMWNLKSTRSWTVQGHYYRNEKLYADALKSYMQCYALMTKEGSTPTNDFLRDLSTMQAQLGKWDEYIDTRRQLITAASNFPQLHWPGFAVGCHFGGRYEVAIAALNNYQVMFRQAQLGEKGSNIKTNEESELCLYRVEIYFQSGDYQGAYDNLVANQTNIIDLSSYMLYQVRLLIKLGKLNEAREIILKEVLPGNIDLLEGIILVFKTYELSLDTVNLNDKTIYNAIRNVFQELLTAFPKSASIIKLSLQYFNVDDAEAPLISYIKPALSKGVPSLFKTLKSLYTSKQISDKIEALLQSYISSLTTNNTFPGETIIQTPTTILSTYIYLAQHYDYYGNVELALNYLSLAEKHTPTFIDLYIHRAKVYKHAGNHQLAYYWIDFARSLDLADRWLNNKCSVYAYQAGLDDHGERTIGTFIKESRGTHVYQYHEQASWWFYQTGLCHSSFSKHYPMALKYLSSVDDFFTQYQESVYDYHQYCIRKCIFRSYTGMVTYLNAAKTHKFYLKTILPLVNMLLTVQHQVNFEKNIVTNNDQNKVIDYQATVKTNSLKTQADRLAEHYKQRPGYVWRLDYIEKRNKKRQKDENDNTEYDHENAGQYTQDPMYDIYGQEYFDSFVSKIAKGDFNVFATEASRYLNIIIDSIANSKTHQLQSNVNTEMQNTHAYQINPATLLLSIQSQTLTNHPLRALQQLKQVNGEIEQFVSKLNDIDNNIVDAVTIDQTIKRHYNGVFPWFQIKSSTPQMKMKVLGSYYQAQAFIEKLMLSKLCLDEVRATSNMNKSDAVINSYKKQYQKALNDGILVNNIEECIKNEIEKIPTLASFCKQIITLCGALLAAYYTQTSIDLMLVKSSFENILSALPTPFEFLPILRSPLQSLVYVCNLVQGKQYISNVTNTIPLITGFVEEITAQQCSYFNLEQQQNVEKISKIAIQFGSKNFPNCDSFFSAEQKQQNQEQFAVSGPDFVTPPEKD